MPTPPKTGPAEIVSAGRALLEEGGIEAVTMQAVAARVGVRPPSLYKHVADRRALIDLVVDATMDDLIARIDGARDATDPRASIRGQLGAIRECAHIAPRAFSLVLGDTAQTAASPAALERSVRPLIDATAALLGEQHALDGARFLTAWALGFLGMELRGAFRLGGDIGAAWTWGVDHAIDALG